MIIALFVKGQSYLFFCDNYFDRFCPAYQWTDIAYIISFFVNRRDRRPARGPAH